MVIFSSMFSSFNSFALFQQVKSAKKTGKSQALNQYYNTYHMTQNILQKRIKKAATLSSGDSLYL
jgi:hypothetical protein